MSTIKTSDRGGTVRSLRSVVAKRFDAEIEPAAPTSSAAPARLSLLGVGPQITLAEAASLRIGRDVSCRKAGRDPISLPARGLQDKIERRGIRAGRSHQLQIFHGSAGEHGHPQLRIRRYYLAGVLEPPSVAAVLRSLPHPPLRPNSALQRLAGLDRRI